MFFSSLIFLIVLDTVFSSRYPRDFSPQTRSLPYKKQASISIRQTFAYQASVEVFGDLRCTGAIINAFWVAAVGSCLENVSAEHVIVRAASKVPQRRGSAHKVSQLVINNSCDHDVCLQDSVALLKVHTRFKFSRKIRPVTLWPRIPAPGSAGWSTTWPCLLDHNSIHTQRDVVILDPNSCGLIHPELMCISGMEERTVNDDGLCQVENTGALVIIRNRLAGFVHRPYNSTVDVCVPISSYIPWIKQVVFGIK